MAKKAAQTPAKSAFAAKAGKFAKDWKEARTVKPNSFDEVIVEPGNYNTRISSARAGVTKNGEGDPYYSINFLIMEGPDKGKYLNTMASIRTPDDLQWISKDMQRLGFEVDELEVHEIEEIVTELNKDKPYVQLYVSHKTQDDGTVRQRVYINKLLEGYSEPVAVAPKKAARSKK